MVVGRVTLIFVKSERLSSFLIEVPDLKIFEGLSGRLIKTKKRSQKLKMLSKI